ncbi:GGDEF domain-containing protein [Bordetella genomosp. 9]|uniref:sensor domain-containing diguanylate cyclase n=1 Tax=Bordetella genomosp. 9 TaxID=1416803 RepID=UPI000A2965A7|nr:sensor domain-containing diguanylate cyclase [Bordetella genomosp. 9]ARP89647.1 GGDEF domain-containing protein [Bordetella genomosp. 9]
MFRIDLRRLILWLCLCSVLLALGNSFYASYRVQREILLNNTLEGNRVYAAKLASTTDTFVRTVQMELAYSALMLADMATRPDKLADEARRLMRQNDHFNSVVIVNAEGRVLAVDPAVPNLLGAQLESGPAQQALRTRHPAISEPYVGLTGRWVILSSHPIFDPAGNYAGFIGGTLYLHEKNALHSLLGEHYYRDGSYLYVVDRTGTLIYHPQRWRIGETISGNAVIDDLMQGQEGEQRVVNSKGVDMLSGYALVPATGWGLVAQRPVAGTLQRMDELLWLTVRNTLPLLLILLVCIGWLSGLIARPLWQLARAARHMDDGEASDRIRNVKSWYFEAAQLKRALLTGLGSINHKMRSLRRESTTDALTSLLNRRGLLKALEEFTATGVPFSVAVIDIDHFKAINDRHGHDAGDEVIRALASLMRQGSRSNDVLARAGGEEFIMLLPATTLDDAVRAAERLRTAMATAVNPAGDRVTISIGVSRYPDHGKEVRAVLKEADKALYHAKNNGRNLTCVAAPDTAQGFRVAGKAAPSASRAA